MSVAAEEADDVTVVEGWPVVTVLRDVGIDNGVPKPKPRLGVWRSPACGWYKVVVPPDVGV